MTLFFAIYIFLVFLVYLQYKNCLCLYKNIFAVIISNKNIENIVFQLNCNSFQYV